MKKLILILLGSFLYLPTCTLLNAQDTIPPTIHVNYNDSQCIQILTVWFDKTYATDDVTDSNSIVITKSWSTGAINTTIRGVYTVMYTAKDEAGNTSTRTVNYRVDDCISPIIELNTEDTVCHPYQTPYVSVIPTVSDNYYPSGQVSLVKNFSNVNPFVKGLYREEYKAVDASGNTTIKIRYVIVGDCNTSSLSKTLAQLIAIYPNPSYSQLNIDNKTHETFICEIYNLEGQIIDTINLDAGTQSIDVSMYTAGLYIFKLTTSEQTFYMKIQINH